MPDATRTLAGTLALARGKARSVDATAFERRFGRDFDTQATERWHEFAFVEPVRRVDEVVSWAVAEVRSAVEAANAAARSQAEREAAADVERRAADEALERVAWSRSWIKQDPGFRVAASNHSIEAVYHWTPIRSLDSIMAVGIRPRAFLHRRGIAYEPHSYGTWQKAVDFEHHVAASLRPQRGMFWQVQDAVLLVLDRRVLARNGAFYVPGNSASRAHDFQVLRRRTSPEDLEALFPDPLAPEPSNWQAEIWVPDGISARRIQRVIVRNPAASQTAERVIARIPDVRNRPAVDIEPELNEWTASVSLDDLQFF